MIAVQPLIARSREKIAFLFTHSIQFCDSSAPSLSAGEKAATKTAAAAMMGLHARVCVMASSHNGCTLPSTLTCPIYNFNRKDTTKRDKLTSSWRPGVSACPRPDFLENRRKYRIFGRRGSKLSGDQAVQG